MKLRCDLANMLRQAADTIPRRKDEGGYAFALREVASHVEQVRDGTASIDEFADYYLLRPREQAAQPQT